MREHLMLALLKLMQSIIKTLHSAGTPGQVAAGMALGSAFGWLATHAGTFTLRIVHPLAGLDWFNIGKAIGSGLRQMAAIEKLETAGRLESLPTALREMARWRAAHPELNLGELADRMELSKSAVNHRLRRLQQMSAGVPPPDHARRSA